MTLQEQEFTNIIKFLNENNCLKDVVLIGSWAEYLYQQTGVIPDGTTVLKTLDIDFMITNLNKPNPPVNLELLAREQGYAVDNDILLGTTKIRTTSRLEIEFLIPKRGNGYKPTYKTSLGVTAQGLRNLELLRDNIINILYLGIKIAVPSPEAYVIHKIIINDERKDAKKEKDRLGILALFPHLDRTKFNIIMETLNKKKLVRVDVFLEKNCLQI